MGGRGSTGARGGRRPSFTASPYTGTATPNGAPAGTGGIDHITASEMNAMSDKDFASRYVNYHNGGRHGGYALYSEGLNGGSAQQMLVNDLGMHAKPKVLSNDDFDALVKKDGLTVIHRGVGTKKSRDNTVYGDKQFVGGSVSRFGQGLYFSTLKRTAASYAGYGTSANKITAAIDKSKVKLIEWNALAKKAHAAGIGVREDFNCWAIKHGYNCVRVKNANYNGSHEDFYIPLDRSILIIRKDSLVH